MSTKKESAEDPKSCWSKAADDEPVFVLLARDPLAPILIELWASLTVGRPGNGPAKAEDARDVAREMRAFRRRADANRGPDVDPY